MDENKLLEYFSGTIEPQHLAEVEAWINESEENKEIAELVYHIYYSTETLNRMQQINTVEGLKKVKKKILNRKRKTIISKIQRIAALLTIPLLATIIYLLLDKKSDDFLELRTNPGMIASFQLPDNSKVWLNSSSYLKCPVEFSGSNRSVYLEGEAYFSVEKDDKKKFVVETTSDVKVEVFGTQFNVEAYPKDNEITTTLVFGKVEMKYLSLENKDASQRLEPGEKAIYNVKNREFNHTKASVSVATAWKDMKVILRKTPIEEMIKILTKRFDVDFSILNDELRKGVYTGTFDEQQLPDILESLKLSTGIHYRITDSKVGKKGEKERTLVELF
jgi:Fe2+-dicitrate sensor, membrane component